MGKEQRGGGKIDIDGHEWVMNLASVYCANNREQESECRTHGAFVDEKLLWSRHFLRGRTILIIVEAVGGECP